MILAIYRTDGKITRVDNLLQFSLQTATDRANEYNRDFASKNKTVEVAEYSDDSLVAYLYRLQAARKKDLLNELAAISRDIDSLYDSLSWLRDEVAELENDD